MCRLRFAGRNACWQGLSAEARRLCLPHETMLQRLPAERVCGAVANVCCGPGRQLVVSTGSGRPLLSTNAVARNRV